MLDVFSQTPLCTHEEISKYTDIFLHISNKEQENKIAIVNVMYYKATEKFRVINQPNGSFSLGV